MEKEQPLAARMRPRTLEDYIGQDHILAPGRLLRRAIQADQLQSLIFYGPPGTGKTTLAMVIANTTESHFEVLNAVLAGVKDIRRVTEEAQDRRGQHGQRTILFVDEVHRWNKAQQDALLPWVENGTVMLIGATTENPYFTVNRALVSRSRIFQLKPLTDRNLRQVAKATLANKESGYGDHKVELEARALDHLVEVANGDARALLNALELAIETTPKDKDDVIRINLEVAEESIQRRAVLYDKEGDYHFDTISAYIKSLRGSDPDASLYWLAKMVYAGEDPRFLFRRMLIFAGEDVGLADPQAMVVVEAAAAAFDRVGLPEGCYHLASATLYLATAPKSNSVMGFFDALNTVEKEKESEVPNHLKDGSRDKEGFGHGVGYLYPHAYRDHWVEQQYLPGALQGKLFYEPGKLGYESDIAEEVQRRREAQLTAALEAGNSTQAPPEILTYTPSDKGVERWLARTAGGVSHNLAAIRDRLFDSLRVQRHHLILDLSADSGLLTWEALRRTPEGGVWALASTEQAAQTIRQQAEHLPDLRQPELAVGQVDQLQKLLDPELRFEHIIGRNALGRQADKEAVFRQLAACGREDATIALAEAVPRHTQRLYDLVDLSALDQELVERLTAAEEAIYAREDDPMVNWQGEDLLALAADAGLEGSLTDDVQTIEQTISESHLARWFDREAKGARPSFAQHLAHRLEQREINDLRDLFASQMLNRAVPWKTTIAYLILHPGASA